MLTMVLCTNSLVYAQWHFHSNYVSFTDDAVCPWTAESFNGHVNLFPHLKEGVYSSSVSFKNITNHLVSCEFTLKAGYDFYTDFSVGNIYGGSAWSWEYAQDEYCYIQPNDSIVFEYIGPSLDGYVLSLRFKDASNDDFIDWKYSSYYNTFCYHGDSRDIIIPASLTRGDYEYYIENVRSDMFRYCYLDSCKITVSEGITNIDAHTFNNYGPIYHNMRLESIDLPNTLTTIGEYAFFSTGLQEVTLPNSLLRIENRAFLKCHIAAIIIPQTVTNIGCLAFDPEYLTSIIVAKDNNYFDSRNKCNAIIDSKTNTLIIGCKNTIIPSSVESIGEFAFSGCKSLTSLNIPSSVTSIGSDAFEGCINIKNITIYGNITSLSYSAFCNIQNLSSVTLKGTEVIPVLRNFYEGSGTSKTNLANCTLYVPASLLEDYKSATGWKQFGAILPLPEEVDYSLYAKDYTVRPGNKARLSLMMSNDTPITSWQTEMALPEGFTLAEDDNAVMLSDDRTVGSDISVAYNTLSDGTVKMLASSMTNSYFTDTYGKVATITLDVAPDVKEGEYFVEFKNSKLIDSSTQKYTYDKAIAKITVKNYQTGDLNSDGENDVLDLVNIVNYIMEKPVDGCIESAADINNDGDINGIDYVAEINLILGITPSANTKARVARTTSSGNVSSSAVFMEAGTYHNMNIKLNGTNGNYSLMQFDITLPEGVKLAEDGAYILGANSMNHDIAVEHIRKNSYRVMMYSSKKSSIREEQNGVLSLSLVADNDMEVGEYNVNISGKLLVDAEGNYIKPASSTVKLTVSAPTAVETITSADAKADIYSLDGTLIRKAGSTEGLKNGMYISAGKKIIIK